MNEIVKFKITGYLKSKNNKTTILISKILFIKG